MSENENDMEALRKCMIDILKDNCDYNRSSCFGCETCYIWQKKLKDLKAKLNKALQPKVTFAIDTLKYDMPSHNSYRRYNYVDKSSNSKKASYHNVYCYYCCMKGHTIAKCTFMRLLVPKGTHQWFPKCNRGFTNHQGSNEDWVPNTSY